MRATQLRLRSSQEPRGCIQRWETDARAAIPKRNGHPSPTAYHPRPWDNPKMDPADGPSFAAMIALVAIVVATVILVFFGIGYGIGRMFL